MNILITGASGLIGRNLQPVLKNDGHQIYRLSRSAPQTDHDVQWDAYAGFTDEEFEKLRGIEAVVHLAGENVAGGSWTEERKKRIRKSRVEGTRTLVDALARLEDPPKIFIGASAIGYYGSRGDEILTEESEPGEGFLADVSREWENESLQAEKRFGARVVLLRIGVVLSEEGGALEKMLTPFKFGIGGTVGSGEQWMSWIALDDLVRIIKYALEKADLYGPVNAVAPNPAQNEQFTDTLGEVLHRPTIIPVPAFGVKLLFGEMGEKLLLEGARVLPQKLLETGFEFDFPKLEPALEHILNRED